MTVNVLTKAQVSVDNKDLVVETGVQDLEQTVAEMLLTAGAAEIPKVPEVPKKAPKAGGTE